jgi:hypothetical protein
MHFAHFDFWYLHKIGRNMAHFQKGEGGRPKGKPNKITADLRLWICNFIHDNKEQIQRDFDSLPPRDRVASFERLLKYALPVLQSTTLSTDFERMTDAELDKVINDLRNNL